MDTLPSPAEPDSLYLRTRAAYHHLVHILDTSLPPPIPDTPEGRAGRNSAAVAQVAALCPANPAEAALAAQFVAANAQAMECLRLTHDLATPGTVTLKCNAQAASMMRQAQAAIRTLLLVQAARARRTTDTDAWAEQIAGTLMAEKLTDPPDQPPVQPPVPQPAAEAEPAPAPVQEAELYATLYPHRAAAIQRAGGLPPDAGFPPPDEPVMRALLAGTTGAPARPDRMAT